MPRIPNTIHGLNPFLCISALQKYVRRGMEREAQEIAAEMFYTSKAYASWVCKRLEVISHEDVGLAAPHLIPLVRTCCEQAREWYDAKKQGRGASVMAVGTAIRALCRAPKSREGDHFHCAVGMPLLIEDRVPVIPDWVLDKHTTQGRTAGRGVDYFREVSAVLDQPPATKDPYEDEAYRLWKLEEQREHAGHSAKSAATTAGDDEELLF